MSEKDLLTLKKIIDDKKQSHSEANAKITLLMESLERDFNCATVDEAREYLIDLEEQKKELQNKLQSGIMELKNELGINTE